MTNEDYFREAAKIASGAQCLRDKCGAIVVLNGKNVGEGFNGPAGNDTKYRKCELDLVDSDKPKSDRTCCVHAEWRAIVDAVRRKGDIRGSTLYFTRVGEKGNILKSGQPYCTVCSRLALDTGVKYFALWHDTEIKLYDSKEYNELSYKFHTK